METVEELKAQLQDAQDSLAAALARIHTLKAKEKRILEDNAKLRARASDEGKPTSRDGREASDAAQDNNEEKAETHFNVFILRDGKKVPGNLMVTKDHLEFTAIEARIKNSRFVGIGSAKPVPKEAPTIIESMSSQEKSAWACCLNPSAVEDHPKPAAQPAPATEEFDDLRRVFEDYTFEIEKPTGTWKIIWTKDGAPQTLTFQASETTRQALHEVTEVWLSGKASVEPIEDSVTIRAKLETVSPTHLPPGSFLPTLTDPSSLLTETHLKSLAAVLPGRLSLANWGLVYATHKHGITLSTLYRRCAGVAPCVLVVKDESGYIFGAFTPESWRLGPRFYGTGESFVFQLEPHRIMYPWKRTTRFKNDFFQLGSPDCLVVGGVGRPALWVDQELLRGSSGCCATFGSPSLSFQEDFKVAMLELWQVL